MLTHHFSNTGEIVINKKEGNYTEDVRGQIDYGGKSSADESFMYFR